MTHLELLFRVWLLFICALFLITLINTGDEE